MKRFSLWIGLSLLLFGVGLVHSAQDNTCPAIVQHALSATDNACANTGRNEACYGNFQIDPTLADNTLIFQQAGDRVDLTAIEALRLSPLDTANNIWGVALMSVQADIPDTVPGQNVSFLLFGDVEIQNAGTAMEAFYFQSGIGAAACQEAENGILIRTPAGVGQIQLVANDAIINIGSTAYLTAEAGEDMSIALLDGTANVEAFDVTQKLEPGFFLTVPINDDLQATGPPTEPEPIPEEALDHLPIESLPTDETDGEGNGGDGTAVDVIPLSGTWKSELGEIVASDGCPAQMTSAFSQSVPLSDSINLEFGDNFDFQSFITATSEEPLPGNMVFDNPSPGVHTMSMSEEGVELLWELHIVSETRMEISFNFDMSALGLPCELSMNYSAIHTGG